MGRLQVSFFTTRRSAQLQPAICPGQGWSPSENFQLTLRGGTAVDRKILNFWIRTARLARGAPPWTRSRGPGFRTAHKVLHRRCATCRRRTMLGGDRADGAAPWGAAGAERLRCTGGAVAWHRESRPRRLRRGGCPQRRPRSEPEGHRGRPRRQWRPTYRRLGGRVRLHARSATCATGSLDAGTMQCTSTARPTRAQAAPMRA